MPEYVKKLRKYVGHDVLMLHYVSVIILNESNELLLQERSDNTWGLPGGIMEPNETFEETLKREVREEMGVDIKIKRLVAIYSNKACQIKYPNGDKVDAIVTSFLCDVSGDIKVDGNEVLSCKYFDVNNLPSNMIEISKEEIGDYFSSNNVVVR